MEKIYKYTTIKSAEQILTSGSVLLNNPDKYNDPYDCVFDVSQKEIKIINNLFRVFAMLKVYDRLDEQFANSSDFKSKYFRKFMNSGLNRIRKRIRSSKELDFIPFFGSILKLLIKTDYSKKQQFDNELLNIDNFINDAIKEVRKHTLVSCFSKRNDSILMWAHYSKSHSGVCLEFDRPQKGNTFQNVIYKSKKPHIMLKKYISHLLANKYLNEIENIIDYNKYKELLKPFFVKSNDWMYEDEVRCVYFDNELQDNIEMIDKKYTLKNMIPTRILIGCKAKEEELNDLIEFANNRKIPIVFMKLDDKSYSIIEDKNKKCPKVVKTINKEITLLRLMGDIEKSLDAEAYLSAFITALVIPAICSKVEFDSSINSKEQYIKWCDTYLPCTQKSDEKSLCFSGEVCWEIKEHLMSYGNIDISIINNENQLKEIILMIEKRKYPEIYHSEIIKENITQNVTGFCIEMINQANRCYNDHKTDIENLTQIKIEDFDKEIETLEENYIKTHSSMNN